jgi:hypothetical protein
MSQQRHTAHAARADDVDDGETDYVLHALATREAMACTTGVCSRGFTPPAAPSGQAEDVGSSREFPLRQFWKGAAIELGRSTRSNPISPRWSEGG